MKIRVRQGSIHINSVRVLQKTSDAVLLFADTNAVAKLDVALTDLIDGTD